MSSKLPRLLEKDFLQEYCVAKGAESSKQDPSVFRALYCSVTINAFEKPFTARDLQSSLQRVSVISSVDRQGSHNTERQNDLAIVSSALQSSRSGVTPGNSPEPTSRKIHGFYSFTGT